ncbi:MAG TPA: DUF2079 domain-containing protein [Miltoncostaeaceae bacterium]|nr:DUF2079 domain-containing protein [Miltoncostaeaceae bacterium]
MRFHASARRVGPYGWLAAMGAAYTVVFSWLAIARYRSFWAGRFDLGNMTQALWSTAHGRPLETTDLLGEQFVRLGAHVDPLLVVFTPLVWTGHLPQALLIAQAVCVAAGALPAFWLGRRWLGDDRFGLVAAAVWLLYPPLQWPVLTDFHPVTVAAPLLMFCIWAAEERRWVVLAVCAPLAALGKEQVGLALAMLGLWLAVRGARRAGALLAVGGVAWSLFAVLVVIPHFNRGDGSAFVGRYEALGESEGDVLRTLLTRPWEALALLAHVDRLTYLAMLLLPLLLLPLAAPLLAAGALPDLAINMLSGLSNQRQIHFHYAAVISPFLIAAALLGLARLRERGRPRVLDGLLGDDRRLMGAVLGAPVVAGLLVGPFAWWVGSPFVSRARADLYSVGAHAAVSAEAVALVPPDAPVSAGNTLGAHLSQRRVIYMFPVIRNARWVVVDRTRPYVGDHQDPAEHAIQLNALRADPAWRVVFDRDGVMVLRRASERPFSDASP